MLTKIPSGGLDSGGWSVHVGERRLAAFREVINEAKRIISKQW
jgi:hypothetical protein